MWSDLVRTGFSGQVNDERSLNADQKFTPLAQENTSLKELNESHSETKNMGKRHSYGRRKDAADGLWNMRS